MLKLLAALLGVGILIYAVVTFLARTDGVPGDPLTASVSLDLKLKTQSAVAVSVAGTSNRIRQVMAAGNDPAQTKPLLEDLTRLHQEVDDACEQLTKLGDSPEAIDHWLGKIHWTEFLALEQEFTKAVKQP